MDLRGCGAGLSLARLPYHSGRSRRRRRRTGRRSPGCARSRPRHWSAFRWEATSRSSCWVKLAARRRPTWPAAWPSARRSIWPRAWRHCAARVSLVRSLLRPLVADASGGAAASDARGGHGRVRPPAAGHLSVRRCFHGSRLRLTARPTTIIGRPVRFRSCQTSRCPRLILAAEDDPLVICDPLRNAHLSSSTCLHLVRARRAPGFRLAPHGRPRPPLDGLADRRMGAGQRGLIGSTSAKALPDAAFLVSS